MNRPLLYIELMKPRLTLMALVTALAGFYMASNSPTDFKVLAFLLAGAAFVGGGANTLNQYFERTLDAKMRRTRSRPLPSGELEESHALGYGIFISCLGLAALFFGVNFLTGLIGSLTLFVYLFLYTPLKTRTVWNTLVGALPGAAPCLMGWAAARGRLESGALILFLILFAWQLPHFFAIAWVYRDDYKNGGFKMLSTNDEDGKKTVRQIVLSSTILFLVSFTPTIAGLAGLTYLFMAIFCGIFMLGFTFYIFFHGLSEVKKFVPLSILYLFLLNLSMVLDKT